MILRGQVKNGVVVLENGGSLADGTQVEVRPTTIPENTQEPVPVSQERREALLALIGCWKMENPPNDEEVDQIRFEALMKKHG